MRRSRIPQLLLITALFAFAPAIFAQSAPAAPSAAATKTGKAQIVGVVVDSLDGRYLSGAEVMIDGANVTLRTDSAGVFRLDSLRPGTYQVGVFHPLLDTLGTTLLTRPFRLGPDSATYIVLAVPSAATLVSKLCRSDSRNQGSSAVIGHVHDPETLQPLAGVEVSIAWTDLVASKEIGIRRTPRLVRDTTDSSGAFRLCGLPSSLDASLQARHGALATAEIPVTLGDLQVELLARDLLLTAGDSAPKSGTATVSGIVSLEGNAAAGGTRVELVGTDRVAITNEKGEFEMKNLPSGSRVLLARHLGFAAAEVPVDLSSHDQPRVSMKLAKFVAVMDPVLVTARRSAALDKVGFGQRSKVGMGYYLGPDRIARMHPYYVTDILRQVPSLRVVDGPYGPAVRGARSTRNGCVQFYLDDMPYREMTPGDVNQFVNGAEVVAVEVYQPGMTPGRFMGTGDYSCTTVVLWTRYTAGN
ncbi:MAG TPA: carboxypeptidase regulatory-like domain-containing protein [Gemmatimonadaceae bacterium]|nr:carboxypeptidase regulatory-like domain-containing protein [Gemmatimonadaceae bacterium]